MKHEIEDGGPRWVSEIIKRNVGALNHRKFIEGFGIQSRRRSRQFYEMSHSSELVLKSLLLEKKKNMTRRRRHIKKSPRLPVPVPPYYPKSRKCQGIRIQPNIHKESVSSAPK